MPAEAGWVACRRQPEWRAERERTSQQCSPGWATVAKRSTEATGASIIDPAASATASTVLTLIGQRLHTPLTILLQTAPGGTGLTVGENDGPAGPTAFSVGVPMGA